MVLEPPRLQDLARWEGCFISSTSRLLLPVDEASLFAGEEGQGPPEGPQQQQQPQARTFQRGGLVCRLEKLVLERIAAYSEPLMS